MTEIDNAILIFLTAPGELSEVKSQCHLGLFGINSCSILLQLRSCFRVVV